MPIVQISVWEGMRLENKKKTVEGITKVFEDLGVLKEAIAIVIYESQEQMGNWWTTAFRKTCPRSLTIGYAILFSKTLNNLVTIFEFCNIVV